MRWRLHHIFRTAVLIKGLDGLIETLVGMLALALGWPTVTRLISETTGRWLSPGTERFSAFYLVSHGIVKLLLAAGLLAERPWTYRGGLWVLLALIVYQFHRFAHTRSLILLGFSFYDVGVVLLLLREMRVHAPAATETAEARFFRRKK